MSFDPELFLPVARACAAPLDGVDEQASYRTALGRAYYAPLLHIKASVERLQGPGTIREGGVHSIIFRSLKDSRVGAFLKVLETLKILRDAREQADYDLDATELQGEEVLLHVERSRTLLTKLHTIPDDRYKNLSFS